MHWMTRWHGPWPFDPRPPREWLWVFGLMEMLFWLAALVVLVVLAVWLIRRLTTERSQTPVANARAILDERYARGELTRDQYLEMRRDLESSG